MIPADAKWTLEQGVEFIRKYQSQSFEKHYNLSLGGGVLNRGWSKHDLDIVAVPANGYGKSFDEYRVFIYWLMALLAREYKSPAMYLAGWNCTTNKLTVILPDGRKTDWFIVYDARLRHREGRTRGYLRRFVTWIKLKLK